MNVTKKEKKPAVKIIIYSLLLLITPALTSQSELRRVKPLVFEGKVLEIGPSPGYGSGGVQAYQLVKYHINQVCEGSYEKTEIVTDHLLMDPDELNDFKVGDVVCVGVTKSKDIASRWNDNQLRRKSDKVEAYYIVVDVFIRNCRCSKQNS